MRACSHIPENQVIKAGIQKKVFELINRWDKEQIDFLITLCEQNSYTFHKQGTDQVAAIVLENLKEIFPIHKVVEQQEVGDHHILKTNKTGKTGHPMEISSVRGVCPPWMDLGPSV